MLTGSKWVRLIRALIAIFVLQVVGFLPAIAQAQNVDWLVNIDDSAFELSPAGGTVEYNVDVTNFGLDPAPATTVTFAVVAGTTLTAVDPGGAITNCQIVPSVGPATVICDVPPLADSETASTVVFVETTQEGVIGFTGTVNDPTGVDVSTGNNELTENTTIVAGSDIAVDIIPPASSSSGEFIDLVVEATNNGPNDSNSFELIFPIPTGMDNFTTPPGCVLQGNNFVCNVGPVAVGQTVSFTFNGQIVVENASTIAATASVQGADPSDAIVSNNTDQEIFEVTGGVDLMVELMSDREGELVLSGEPVKFTIDPSYTGDDPTDISIVHEVPANFDFNIADFMAPGWTISVGGASGREITFTSSAGLGPGQDVQLPIIMMPMTAISPGTPVSQVEISADGPQESNQGNNTSSVITEIEDPFIDLRANKTGPFLNLAVVGSSYDYTISATNLGNAEFLGTVVMEDQIPAGLTVNSVTPNGWICTPSSGVGPFTMTCTLSGAMLDTDEETPELVYNATVTGTGTISNTMAVSSPDGNYPDENGPNDVVTQNTGTEGAAFAADLGITKNLAETVLEAGEIQTYTFEITNSGPEPSLNILFSDDFLQLKNSASGPGEGFESINFTPGPHATNMACTNSPLGLDAHRLNCNIDALAICTPGTDCPVIVVEARHGGNGGSITNNASAYSFSTPDPDLTDNIDDTVFTQEPRVDVTVVKTVSSDEVPIGQDVTYTVSAQNVDNGLSDADDVVITDTLPLDVLFISAIPASACTTTPVPGVEVGASDRTVICDFGTIANGEQQAATITVRPLISAAIGDTLINNAEVVTSTPETDVEPNTDSAAFDVIAPDTDLLVNKDDSGFDPLELGSNVTYTITVTNQGPSASQNIVVTDRMPASIIDFQSVEDENGNSCATVPAGVAAVGDFGVVITCDWPYLAAGDSFDIFVEGKARAKGNIINSVEIDSFEISNGFDRLESNNVNEENTTVRTRADLEVVSKVAMPSTVSLEDDFIFEITLAVTADIGLAEAENVVISDSLPSGMFLTGTPTSPYLANACMGFGAGDTNFSCSFGDVPSGTMFTISVPVEVRESSANPQSFSNTVVGETASFEGDPLNNEATGGVTVLSSEISGTVYRDFDEDVSQNLSEDQGLGGVPITLTGVTEDGHSIGPITVFTDADGNYVFPNLPAGDYTVARGALPPVYDTEYLDDGVSDPGGNGSASNTPLTIVDIPLGDNDVGPDNDFTVHPEPRIGLAKQVSGPISINPDASFEVPFSFVVENFSEEGLIGVEVTDTLTGASPLFGALDAAATSSSVMAPGTYTVLTGPGGTCGSNVSGFNGDSEDRLVTGLSMAANNSCTITLTLRVQPTVPAPAILPSGGLYENQADVTGTGELTGDMVSDTSDEGPYPDSNNNQRGDDGSESTPTPVTPAWMPGISLVKSSSITGFSTPPQPLDEIEYEFEIRNTGNVNLSNIVLTDILPGLVFDTSTIALLAPDQTVTLTGQYPIDLDDINAGNVDNEATVTGGDPFGIEQTDTDEDMVSIDQVPGIAVIKIVDNNGIQDPTNLNDPVRYRFEVRNTGNVTLTGITLADPLDGATVIGGPLASLAPGATNTTEFSVEYETTQDAINDGEVRNQATVMAGNFPVSDLSGETFADDEETVLPTFQFSDIAIVKTADESAFSDPSMVNDVIQYTFTVTNLGNTTLTNVVVDDPLTGLIFPVSTIASLEPGAANAVSLMGSYFVTQDDIDNGKVDNQATVEADTPDGGTVDDLSGDTIADDKPTTVPLIQDPAIALIKLADNSALSDPPTLGEQVTFTFEVRNTGNVMLTDITVADSLPGIVSNGATLASLDPGQTDTVTFEAVYDLAQDDIDNGIFENSATVTATTPDSGTVEDVSGTTFEDDDPTVVNLDDLVSIALIKAVDTSGLSSPPELGDELTYTFEVFNNGNVTLTDVTVTDLLPNIIIEGGPIPSLIPGQIDGTSITARYIITADDLDLGTVENSATVTGTPPFGPDITDDSGSTFGEDAPIITPLVQGPDIELVKIADTSLLQSPPQIGDEVLYKFEVTNPGNVTLVNVTVTDTLPGLVLDGNPIAVLATGETDTTTITGSYILTADDLTNGMVTNTADVTGTPPTGPPVTDTDDEVVELQQEPGIALDKVADGSALVDGAEIGEIVTYTFTITNTGNVPLSNLTITDALPGLVLLGSPIPVMNPAAAADGTDIDSVTYTAEYTVTATDLENVNLINVATVTADFGNDGQTISAEDTETTLVGNIEAISEVFPPFTTDGGTTTDILASDLLNLQPVTLDDVEITVLSEDPGVTLDPNTGLITLTPGQPAGTYVVEYQITSTEFPSLTDTTTETVTQAAIVGINTTKTQELIDNGDGVDGVGDTVIYTILVENTGNVTLDDVTVTDSMFDLNSNPQVLDTGPDFVSASVGSVEGTLLMTEVATYTASFELTLDVVNAGGLENSVVAEGTPDIPDGIPIANSGDLDADGNVFDVSDDGNDADGNGEDDPTVLLLNTSNAIADLVLTKTTPNRIVNRGDVIPYTIVVQNQGIHVAGPLSIVDQFPSGMLYVPGSAAINGSSGTVVVDGNEVSIMDVTVPAMGSVSMTLSGRVLNGARWGRHVNEASVIDPTTGAPLAQSDTATVEILPEAVFDCSDVIGKVFDDVNGDGYQNGPTTGNNPAITDQSFNGGKGGKLTPEATGPRAERGLPGVRLATVDGTIITTDENGLFSVPCATLPATAGSNFVLKVDERTLPSGYSMTTRNPVVSLLTPGMMSEINFGARLGRMMRVDLNAAAFSGTTLSPQIVQGIGTMVARLANDPAGVDLIYHIPANAGSGEIAQARSHMELIAAETQRQWQTVGRGRLTISQSIQRAGE